MTCYIKTTVKTAVKKYTTNEKNTTFILLFFVLVLKNDKNLSFSYVSYVSLLPLKPKSHFHCKDMLQVRRHYQTLDFYHIHTKRIKTQKILKILFHFKSSAWDMASPRTRRVLKELKSENGNNTCCDCGALNPQWVSVSYGIWICLQCSGRHRGLGINGEIFFRFRIHQNPPYYSVLPK